MPRDVRIYLEDIVTSIDRIREYTRGVSLDGFLADTKTQDAVIRNLEIIGEAVKSSLPLAKGDTQAANWRKIVEFRNVLAHEYFGVDLRIVWDVVENKLGPLREECGEMLASLDSER